MDETSSGKNTVQERVYVAQLSETERQIREIEV